MQVAAGEHALLYVVQHANQLFAGGCSHVSCVSLLGPPITGPTLWVKQLVTADRLRRQDHVQSQPRCVHSRRGDLCWLLVTFSAVQSLSVCLSVK